MNSMQDRKKQFLHLAMIEQKKYSEIENILDVQRETLTQWWDDLLLEREEIAEIRQLWKNKCPDNEYRDFEEWYRKTPRECHYCQVTEVKIKKLIKASKIKTKRLITRGRKLEIERKEPNLDYDEMDNLVFACYWCNNAKSDEFSESEFTEIGSAISKIWKERLSEI